VFAANHGVRKNLETQSAKRDPGAEDEGGCSGNGGIGAKPIVGQIAFDSDKGPVQLDVHRALPALEFSHVGVERAGAGAAQAQVDVPFGYLNLSWRGERKRYERGEKQNYRA
jgi:hypothetical protein